MEETGKSEKRLELREVNPYLICVLCGGYFVDAASIIECLHTFCWTCIVKYLEKNKFCPICDVQAYKIKPELSIRPDYTIQRLTYKMVPGLFANEMQRRKEFYLSSDPPPTALNLPPSSFYAPDDNISLSLEYYEAGMNNNDEKCRQVGDAHDSLKMKLLPHKRYLQCPAAVTINHLKKFVRMKYGLAAEQMVDIIYQEECLPDNFSLMDVAYTFMWDRTNPMRFSYRILERAAVPTESKSDINGAHGYSAPRSESKRSNWSRSGPNSSSENSTTNTLNGRQPRGNVFSKRKSDSGNESNETSVKDEENDELDDLSLIKRLRVNARRTRSADKKGSTSRQRSRSRSSTSKKLRKKRKTIVESETLSDYSTGTSPDYPGSSVPSNPDDNDSLDDYAMYEDDIEEITDDFDDEDEEGRLWISPIEDEEMEKEPEVTSRESSMDNDVGEIEKKSKDISGGRDNRCELKLKKKSKKGKHHHHHHHHKHHERHARRTPPATILKSEGNDIMKLKVKLNPIVSCEKYNKSSVKPKVIGEVVPISKSSTALPSVALNSRQAGRSDSKSNESGTTSSSTNTYCAEKGKPSSIDKACSKISSSSEISSSTSRSTNSSPTEGTATDRVGHGLFIHDEDSQNSNSSDVNAQLNFAKNVLREDLRCQEEEKREAEAKIPKEKRNSPASNRPAVMPASAPSSINNTSKSSPPPLIFTSSDSNSSRSKSPLLHPPSSITVSKITAAEKRKLDEDKLLNSNPDSKAADSLRPSLEIMLVNGPKMQSFFKSDVRKEPSRSKSSDGRVTKSAATSSTTTSTTASSTSTSSSGFVSSPLVRLQKMSINLPSVTVTHSSNTSKPYTTKTIVQNGNEHRIQAGSIEISLQKENTAPQRKENRETKKSDGQKKEGTGDPGVLDLSSTSQLTRPTASSSTPSLSVQTGHPGGAQLKKPKNVTPVSIKQQVNKVLPQTSKVGLVSGGNGVKASPVSGQSLTVLSNAAAHVVATESRLSQVNTKPISGNSSQGYKASPNPHATPAPAPSKKSHPVNNVNNPLQQNMSLKIPNLQQRPMNSCTFKSGNSPARSKPMNIPKLNEIDRKQFIRPLPHGNNPSGVTPPRPGPNQFVRNITDPSVMIYARQQNAGVVAAASSLSKKYAGGNLGRLSAPPGVIPIASMFRQSGISRDIEKVSAGLQMKTAVNAELTSVK